MRKDWTLIRAIHGGHKYWRRADGAVGISDGSGTYPENCESGDKPPLLLDVSRPVTMGQYNSVPVTNSAGDQVSTPATAFEALWVATRFSMKIEASEDRAHEVVWRFEVQSVDIIEELAT